MIWMENVSLIVMLTCVREHGKQKCDQYWPQELEETYTLDQLEVSVNSSEKMMEGLLKRKIQITDLSSPTQEKREIVHL